MNKEAQCRYHRNELERAERRLTDLHERGVDALSRYDREIAFGGDDELALRQSTWLVTNHVRYFTERLSHCDEPARQITLFDASREPEDFASPVPQPGTGTDTGPRPS